MQPDGQSKYTPAKVGQEASAGARTNLSDYLSLLESMVNLDSGEDHPEGIRAVQELVSHSLGPQARVVWLQASGVSHLRLHIPGNRGEGKGVMLLGHADTVFPRGTAGARPFRISGERALGPGTADMKGGLVVALAAVKELIRLDAPRPDLDLVVVGDEETRCAPPPFMEGVKDLGACLVLECGRPGGGFVVARKGGFWAHLKARGRSAHSGVASEQGANAITALCPEVSRIAGLHGSRPGLTLVPGKISGGTAVNVVPEYAQASIDVRSPSQSDLDWAEKSMAAFGNHAGVSLELQCELRWPPMAEEDGMDLARQYAGLAGSLGIEAAGVRTGGMSDGNWFSSAGVPTLDGLGPVGAMDHGPDEYIELGSIAPRVGLLAGLLCALAP